MKTQAVEDLQRCCDALTARVAELEATLHALLLLRGARTCLETGWLSPADVPDIDARETALWERSAALLAKGE